MKHFKMLNKRMEEKQTNEVRMIASGHHICLCIDLFT